MCIRDRSLQPARAAAQRDARLHALDEDFAFIADCNVGSEFMSDQKMERLHEVAKHTWQRTLDDRLGLSRDEMARRTEAALPLPVQEFLLADKPEHCIIRPPSEHMPENSRWGFAMAVPELLYNLSLIHI